jgi:hypothetical protein
MLSFGFANDDDHPTILIEHSLDNGFVIAGKTLSVGAGDHDMLLVKTDAMGVLLWSKTYGKADSEMAYDLIEYTVDQGFVIAGTMFYQEYTQDILVVRTNSVGTKLWARTFGLLVGLRDFASHVIQSNDNGIVLAGGTESYGNTKHTHTHTYLCYLCICICICYILSSLYPLSTLTTGAGAPLSSNKFLMKLDSAGTLQWSKTFAVAWGGGLLQHSVDNGYVISASSKDYTIENQGYGWDFASTDILIIKTDTAGVEVWSKIYGGTGFDNANDVIECSDTGLAIAGETSSWGTCVCVCVCVFVCILI